MRRIVLVVPLLALLRCAAPAPAPETVPEPEPVTVAAPAEEKVLYTVRVNASGLNVRREPDTGAEILTQVRRGQVLGVLASDESWMRVRLDGGVTGWVASRFVVREGQKAAVPKKKGCPADSDFAFVETPTLTFSDSSANGLVVVDATVDTRGNVTSTKLVSNSTGDEALGFLAEREIRSAKFTPPIRNCVPRSFIFTYRRSF